MAYKPSAAVSGTLSLLVLLLLWEICSHVFAIPVYLAPPPSAVLREIFVNWAFYVQQTAATLLAVLLGFGLSVVLGLVIAIPTAYSRAVQVTVYPLILLLQGVPKIALAPILIVFFGFGLKFQVVVIASVAFFPIVINVVQGLNSTDPDLIILSRVLRTPRIKEFWMIALPQAAPSLFAGMKIAMTLSVIGAVVAEFVSSEVGLGHTLLVANADFNPAMGFAAIVLLSLMSFGLFGVIRLLELLLLPWSDETSLQIGA